jgi:glycerate 2-kinase
LPISDGGDGLIEALLYSRGGRLVRRAVTGPLGERRTAVFGLAGRTAIVEMARASGLALVPPGRLDPMRATSYGTGELIRAALDRGASSIWIGLGGSATNDGGAGLAQALGARLLDAAGREIGRGPAGLDALARVDASGLDSRLARTEIRLVSDVTNPLLGPRGSARVYGPQKGASPREVERIERGLARWARVLRRDLNRDVATVPGSGAAGGLGSGLLAFTKARLLPGAPFVLDAVGARAKLRSADLVLTGEGRFDAQSLFGKAPAELAKLAARSGVPCALVCGQLEPGLERRLARLGIGRVVELSAGRTPESAMLGAPRLLAEAAEAAVLAFQGE